MPRRIPASTTAESYQCLECGWYSHENAPNNCPSGKPHPWSKLTCIDSPGDNPEGVPCSGTPVEYRYSYGSGRAKPRCSGHHDLYLDRLEQITSRYGHPDSDVPPADFDPTYAGERWDEDD